MGDAYATLSGGFEPRQIQPDDFVWASADHRVSDLSRRGREESARLSIFHAGAGGDLVRHVRSLARNHSRARRVYARAHGKPASATVRRFKAFCVVADCFRAVLIVVLLTEISTLRRLDESTGLGAAATFRDYDHGSGRDRARSTGFGDGE